MNIRLIKLPLPYYGPDDGNGAGGKTPAQLEREKIKVTSNATKAEEEQQQQEEQQKEENNNQEEQQEEEAEAEVEVEETNEDGGEENNNQEQQLTPEQQAINKLERKVERLQRRIGQKDGNIGELKKQLTSAQAALDAKIAEGQQPLTEEEVNRRARALADQDLTAREFEAAQEKLIDDAKKVDKNFISKVNEMANEVALLPAFFVGALSDLDNGGEVLNYLTDNHDEYEDLLALTRKPAKVIKGLVDISNKLAEAKKPKPKKISNAPEPPKAPKGNASSPDVLPTNPTKNMAEFIRIRNKQIADRKAAGGR